MAGPAATSTTRSAATVLVLVAGAYLLTQVLLFSPTRAPSWDEAIYLSQVTPDVPAVRFAPSRARGITFLVAPVTEAGGSVEAVRVFLVVSSSLALVASFLPWVPTIGWGTPLAAFLFGFTWLALFYGSEVMPNLWSAALGVATAGAVIRRMEGRARWEPWTAAALLGTMSLVRPLDALVLFAGLALYVLLLHRSSFGVLAPLAAGLAAGWLPWLVEMSVRYGGPLRALDQAATLGHLTGGGIEERLLQNLALTDGPALGPDPSRAIPVAGVAWWAVLAVLTATALVRTRGMPRFGPVACASVAGAGLAAEYLLLVSGLAPRFLLPAYALLSIPAAVGLVSLWAGGTAARVGAAIAVGTIAALAAWHIGTANRIEANAAAARAGARAAGQAGAHPARGSDCLVASSTAFPQVAYASGCRGRQLRGVDAASLASLGDAASTEASVFVVLTEQPPAGSPLAGLRHSTVRREGRSWFVYPLARFDAAGIAAVRPAGAPGLPGGGTRASTPVRPRGAYRWGRSTGTPA